MTFYPLSLPFILFALIALLYAVLRPVYVFFQATRTVYALTDHRALILKPTLRGKSSASYSDFAQIERRGLPDGRGDLVFAEIDLHTGAVLQHACAKSASLAFRMRGASRICCWKIYRAGSTRNWMIRRDRRDWRRRLPTRYDRAQM